MSDAINGAAAPPESILLRDRGGRPLYIGDGVILPNAQPIFEVVRSELDLRPNLPPGARTVSLRCNLALTYVPGGMAAELLRIATFTDPEAAGARPNAGTGPKLVIP